MGLGEAGAKQVFVTLRDNAPRGRIRSEGLVHIDETPGGAYPVTRRESFDAVRRLVDELGSADGLAPRAARAASRSSASEQGEGRACRASDARSARDNVPRRRALRVHRGQDELATQAQRPARGRRPACSSRLDRARALLAPGARTGAPLAQRVSRAGTHSAPTTTRGRRVEGRIAG